MTFLPRQATSNCTLEFCSCARYYYGAMECILSREALVEGLQNNVVSGRPTTLPILANALLQAKDGKLVISTTDLDTGLRTSVEAKVEKPGATTLPARRLLAIVRELPGTELTLKVDSKNTATIQSGNSVFKILGLPAEDFPTFPKPEGGRVFKLKQATLRDMFKKTSYAISMDESRYVLNGVLLSLHDGKMMMVATDGRRLALVEEELEFPKSSECDAILPTKAVQELLRSLEGDGTVTLTLTDSQASFDLGSVYLVSKLIEGNYPNYRQVIPAETKERVALERETLHNAVRRVALLSSDKSSSVKLHFTRGQLDITANTPEVGEAKESLPTAYKGKDLTIAFNPEFLMDPLRALDVDEVSFDLIDETSPGVLRTAKPFLYVIMPMRTA